MANFIKWRRELRLEQAVRQVRDARRKTPGGARRFSSFERLIAKTLRSLRGGEADSQNPSAFERAVARVHGDALQKPAAPSEGQPIFRIVGSARLEKMPLATSSESGSSGRAAKLRARVDAAINGCDRLPEARRAGADSP